MSQVNPNNPPEKSKALSSAMTAKQLAKAKKQELASAKRKRREEALAKKAAELEQAAALTLLSFAVGVIAGELTGDMLTAAVDTKIPGSKAALAEETVNEAPNEEDAADQTAVEENGDGSAAPAEQLDNEPAAESVASETTTAEVTLPTAGLPVMNRKERKRLERQEAWKLKTAQAAERAAQAKAAQEKVDALAAEQATRNGDAPTEEVSVDLPDEPKILGTSAGEAVVYDSTNEPKIATLNGENFDAAKASGNRYTGDVKHVDTFTVGMDEALKSEPATEETNVEDVSEQPTEAPIVEEPAETPAVETAAPQPVTGPTLVVNNTESISNERAELIMAASRFYGSCFNAVNSATLTDAYRFLMMAIRAEADDKPSNVKMALKKALSLEESVFATVQQKKAA